MALTTAKRTVARYEVPACIRCGKPIAKGSPVEQWTTPHNKTRWVHDGCEPAAQWGGSAPDQSAIDRAVQSAIDKRSLNGHSSGTIDLAAVDVRINAKLDPVLRSFGDLRSEQGQVVHHLESVEEQVATFNATVGDLSARVTELDKLRKVEITVTLPERPTVVLKEHVHPAFEEILFHIACGDQVMLVGPTGCGKTHLAMQLAKALKLDFDLISCSVGITESSILGMREPNDKGGFIYQLSPFATMFGKGGLFLWDEVDALDPNVFLSVNAALSNRVLSLPKHFKNPKIDRHKDFVCLAAANTYGSGADRRYVGRNQLDGASVDRFVCITMDYDQHVERSIAESICGKQADELLSKLWGHRTRMQTARLERNLSTRFIERAARWISAGKDIGYVERKLFEGWRDDEVRKVKV